ncbi:MAG: hypothetical protein ABI789_12810 [Usitatibacter sp.]
MRTMRLKSTIICAVVLLGLGACTTAPVYNVADAPVSPASGKTLQASQVRQAIVTAGSALGWRIVDAGPGKLEGTLNLRTHVAVVEIPYSATKYSIQYKGGENLMATGGTVHKNYNGWVQNLDRGIRSAIATL